MNEFLTIFLVVATYFVAGFALLGICTLMVSYIYSQQSKYNNNRQDITNTNRFNRTA